MNDQTHYVEYGRTKMDAAQMVSEFKDAAAFVSAKQGHPDFAVVEEGEPRTKVLTDLYNQAREILPATTTAAKGEMPSNTAKDAKTGKETNPGSK